MQVSHVLASSWLSKGFLRARQRESGRGKRKKKRNDAQYVCVFTTGFGQIDQGRTQQWKWSRPKEKKMNSMCGRRCWIIMRRINTQCSTELQQKNESIKTWSILPCQKFYIRFRIFSLWNNQSSYIQHHVQNVCFFNISIFFIIIGAETNGKKRVGKEKKYTLHHQYTEFEFLVFTSDLHQGERNCLNN